MINYGELKKKHTPLPRYLEYDVGYMGMKEKINEWL